MTVRIVRIADSLPGGFAFLRTEADSEGIHNMARLEAAWNSGERFAPTGALFAALTGDTFAGVGGVSVQPGEPAMRMTRLYVRPSFRRQGLGRALATAMMRHGAAKRRLLTVNARASDAAVPFWEMMGFTPVSHRDYTHILQVPESVV
jgi:GNAT superfamily N-acetyltransferase